MLPIALPSSPAVANTHVCALNGKYSSLKKPESVSLLCAGVTPRSISKWQGGME